MDMIDVVVEIAKEDVTVTVTVVAMVMMVDDVIVVDMYDVDR